MKHSGRAQRAALKLILYSLLTVGIILAVGVLAVVAGAAIMGIWPALLGVWLLFALFTLYFFRDPEARVPPGENLVLSPAHGKVDVIDSTNEPLFMGGPCQRISMFLSVIDVHVQNAPVTGKVAFLKHTPGEFMNAMRVECATNNENVLLGFEAATPSGLKIAVRLIAGVLARRIIPYVQQGEQVLRGERISLVQFGSRADVYLPANAKIQIKLGDHVTGGETVLALLDQG